MSSGSDAVAIAAGDGLNAERAILPAVFNTPTKSVQSHSGSRRASLNGSGSTGALLSLSSLSLQPTPPKDPPPFAPATIQLQLGVVDKSSATATTNGAQSARPAIASPSHAHASSGGSSGGGGSNGHASAAAFVVSPPKFGARSIRSRPLSRDSSKEMLQQGPATAAASALTLAASAAAAASAAVPSRSSSTSSLTTTSIFTSPQPQSGATAPGQQHHTLISTTTSFAQSTPAGSRTLGDESSSSGRNHVTLPSVTTTTNTSAATSLTASLLAAANKDTQHSLPTLLQLPQIVSAQQQRLLLLESLTSSQGESILELQRTIRNLQKQLVFVMAAVPSTSGTGGVASLQPQSRSRGSSSGTTDTAAGLQPHRSRSSTELHQGQAGQQPLTARASKRLSGGSDRDRSSRGLHSGSHTHSTESMESLPHSRRSSKPSSRPTSKTNSRYGSPRNAGSAGAVAAAAAQLLASHQAPHAGSNTSSAKSLHSSHHFTFHPSTSATGVGISSQPPPGQLHVDHSVGIAIAAQQAQATPGGGSSRRARLVASQAPDAQHPHPPQSGSTPLRPSRRLTPPHMEEMQQHLQHQQQQQQQQQQYQQHQQQHHYPQQHYAQQHHPQSQIQPLSYASPATRSPGLDSGAPPQSLDTMRPLPLQHTVTRGKHGVTEYVLSFRDESGGAHEQDQYGDAPDAYSGGGGGYSTHGHHGHGHGHGGHAGHAELSEVQEYDDDGNSLEYSRSGSYAYRNHAGLAPFVDSVNGGLPAMEPAASPRSARVEMWKQQQGQGQGQGAVVAATPAPAAVKEKKKNRKSADRRSGSGAFSAAGLPLSAAAATAGGAALIDIDRRDAHAHAHAHAGDAEDQSSAPTGATAAALRKAARKREKEKSDHARGVVGSERKLCKVAGCGELRLLNGTDKYCKAHSGPAPINPNARKMMFQH